MLRSAALTMGAVVMLAVSLWGQSDSVMYIPKPLDPVNEELKDIQEAREEAIDSVTDAIRDRQDELEEMEKASRQWLTCDFGKVVKPESPEVFQSNFYFPPIRQYITGTCWCYAGTSFLESEIYRIHGKQIKLSEMYTVYWEWVEKARRFVRERGDSHIWPGSETNGVFRMMKMYGAVPEEAYPGYIDDPRHNHSEMSRRIREYLRFACDTELWDEQLVLESIKSIMHQYMGEPPESFEYDGETYTPTTFFSDVMKVNLDDYVALMSTLAQPFYTQGPFDVPDNWWFDSTYYNIPLDEWYKALKQVMLDGYTVAIGGDCSEPGLNGFEDAAFVPDFDIPQEYINQHSREYRMDHKVTTDDHGMHVVGFAEVEGRDWYLLKDSSSRAQWGVFPGYFFFRDDYMRLKMMEFAVHKDAVPELMEKFAGMGIDLGSD